MKYKLLKEYPWLKIWDIIDSWDITIEEDTWVSNSLNLSDYPDFFEPIVEKKTYDDLKVDDAIFINNVYWRTVNTNFSWHARSETFITREEAEDEHKRREWAVRKNKFVPESWQDYFYYCPVRWTSNRESNTWHTFDYISINSWLAFRTYEDCQDAIDNHDIIRLFYTIR